MELVKQISVFVENASGRLSKITGILAEAGINIRAISIADTTDFGILRMIVQDPEKAVSVLSENDIMVKSTEVIVAEIEDRPAGLDKAMCLLRDNYVTVDYLYAFVTKQDKACVIIKTDNAEKAIKALTSGGIHILQAGEVYAL